MQFRRKRATREIRDPTFLCVVEIILIKRQHIFRSLGDVTFNVNSFSQQNYFKKFKNFYIWNIFEFRYFGICFDKRQISLRINKILDLFHMRATLTTVP